MKGSKGKKIQESSQKQKRQCCWTAEGPSSITSGMKWKCVTHGGVTEGGFSTPRGACSRAAVR